MYEKKVSPGFKLFKGLLRLVYPKMEVVGAENLPDAPCVIVGNHTQMNGPICCELYFPVERYTWCNAQMLNRKEVPAYAYQDFWSGKPKYICWFYKILSHVIAPLAAFLLGNANTIGVYRDARIISTFRESMARLDEGASVVIFPECHEKHNNIIYKFQDGFVDLARLYFKRTGKALQFVPMYIAPALKKMYLGKPIRYCPENAAAQERARICNCLMDEITSIAAALPRHRVVPYPNLPKRLYPYNIPVEVTKNEEAGC
ncbi:MAG: 1-acyl-sn-glycerol-3-phosphate acyltransferase [Clostridia bacterium]|nr:1-acyl-sn-glycerol-3-phosphate acyltransferase [Clostridia bacterium]